MTNTVFRPLLKQEKRVLDKLFELGFVGREQLWKQLDNATVEQLNNNGSLKFNVNDTHPISVEDGLVVEARYCELDTGSLTDVCVNVLLHVKYGKLYMLEVYKDDSSPLLGPLDPEKFVLFTEKPTTKNPV